MKKICESKENTFKVAEVHLQSKKSERMIKCENILKNKRKYQFNGLSQKVCLRVFKVFR